MRSGAGRKNAGSASERYSMSRNTTKRYKYGRRPEEEDAEESQTPAAARRLPFEAPEEYKRFAAFLNTSPHSVREAYRNYCAAGGKVAKKDPPSNWYTLYHGEYAAFRKTDQRLMAIERAGKMHGRFVDWEAVEAIVNQAIDEGKLEQGLYRGEFGEVMTVMKVVEVAFMSLAINQKGEPLPGVKTW